MWCKPPNTTLPSSNDTPISKRVLNLNHQFELKVSDPLELVDRDVLVVRPALDADRHIRAHLPQPYQHERTHVVLLILVRIALGRKPLERPIIDPAQTVLVELRLQRKKREMLNCRLLAMGDSFCELGRIQLSVDVFVENR